MTKNKHEKYYKPLIIEFLGSRTPGNQASRERLKASCKIPQSSFLKVIGELENDGIVSQEYWFPPEKFRKVWSVKLTPRGRITFLQHKREASLSGIPQSVRYYLDTVLEPPANLWPLQKQFVDRSFLTRPRNVSVFAYPATGKTLLTEMAIVKALSLGGRALFCTPYKSLDWQKQSDFKKRFKLLRFSVAVSDGDNYVHPRKLRSVDLVVATFERVSSAIFNDEDWLRGINLVCVDEISLLADEDRGGTLDWLLTYFHKRRPQKWIITLGPPVRNADKIAECFQAEPLIHDVPKITLKKFLVHSGTNSELTMAERGGEIRKVKTRKSPISYLVDRARSNNQKTLVFYESRSGSELLSKSLVRKQPVDKMIAKQTEQLFPASEETPTIRTLRALLSQRIAFHHSGVTRKMKAFIEGLLRDGEIDVIVATTTLSHGVDYKIDNVIIDMRVMLRVRPNLPVYEFINLIGRAGRPSVGHEGNAYLLVNRDQEKLVFDRFFLGSLDPLTPASLKTEILSLIILSLAKRSNLRMSTLNNQLAQTFSSKLVDSNSSRPARVMRYLFSNGFLESRGKTITLTRLGKLSLAKGLAPREVVSLTRVKGGVQEQELLDLAIQINLGRRTRSGDLRSAGLAKDVLSDFIRMKPLGEIVRMRSRGNLYEADVLQLGKDAAFILARGKYFLEPRVRPLVSSLVDRLRDNLLSSEVL